MADQKVNWKDFCPKCKFLYYGSFICSKFEINLIHSPEDFNKKCSGEFYKEKLITIVNSENLVAGISLYFLSHIPLIAHISQWWMILGIPFILLSSSLTADSFTGMFESNNVAEKKGKLNDLMAYTIPLSLMIFSVLFFLLSDLSMGWVIVQGSITVLFIFVIITIAFSEKNVENLKKLLYEASHKQDLDKIKDILNSHSYMRSTLVCENSKSGFNPLTHSISNNNLDMAKLFIENGADVNHKDINGQTPLTIAVKNHNIEIVKLLIEKGADINHVDNKENNALMFASKAKDSEMTSILVEAVISKGRKLYDSGKLDDAIILLENAVSVYKNHTKIAVLLSSVLSDRGSALFSKMSQPDLAYKDFVRATEANPENWRAFINLCSAAKTIGNYQLALENGKKALKLNPELGENTQFMELLSSLKVKPAEDTKKHKLSRCRYFCCPKCKHVFTKESNLTGWKVSLLTPSVIPTVSGTLTCQYCGYVFHCQAIYNGKHDLPKENWKELPPPHEL